MDSYILSALLALLTCGILYVYTCFKYWESKGIPYVRPSYPFGNVGIPFFDKTGFTGHLKNIYRQLQQDGLQYGGFYTGTTPVILAVQPEFIKAVLSTEFKHFTSQGTRVDEKIDPLSANIFHMEGQKWKDMRQKLVPTLTSGNIKNMFGSIAVCGKQMNEYVERTCSKPVTIHSVLENFTTNVAISCLLGLDNSNFENSKFIGAAKGALRATPRGILRHFLTLTAPFLINVFKLKLFSDEITGPFLEMINNVAVSRNDGGGRIRNVIRILMENKQQNGLTMEQIAAQAFGLYLGGFDTTSYTLSYCLYELAWHPDVQTKLRQEIDEITNGTLTYDEIMQMEYLDQVIKETLRLYPLAPNFRRACTEEFTLPNKAILKKGSTVFISVMDRDEKYFENPEDFQPERFSEANSSKIKPFTYIPFGGGPRICIGKRFAMLQMKVALASLLKNYLLTPHPSLKYPMEFDKYNAFVLYPRNAIVLNFNKIQ